MELSPSDKPDDDVIELVDKIASYDLQFIITCNVGIYISCDSTVNASSEFDENGRPIKAYGSATPIY